MENEKKNSWFCRGLLNEFGEYDVIFCDSLEEAQKNSEKIEKQGYPTKIFKEVV